MAELTLEQKTDLLKLLVRADPGDAAGLQHRLALELQAALDRDDGGGAPGPRREARGTDGAAGRAEARPRSDALHDDAGAEVAISEGAAR